MEVESNPNTEMEAGNQLLKARSRARQERWVETKARYDL